MKRIMWAVLAAAICGLPASRVFPEGGADGGSTSGGVGFMRWLKPVEDPELAEKINRGMGARDRNPATSTPTPTPEPPQQEKTLTIVNHSGIKAAIYLDDNPGETQVMLGFVEAYSRNVFSGIPARGRWYVTIEPRGGGRDVRSVSFTLYVKEAQYEYSHEVWDDSFR